MAEARILAEQFDDLEQQEETATVGMWTFLATEVLFFGGLFVAYIVYRTAYPEAFAEASHHNNLLLGSINTAVLLTSSLTMALAVHAAQLGNRKRLLTFLFITLLFGFAFLGVKAVEYSEHIAEGFFPGARFKARSSVMADQRAETPPGFGPRQSSAALEWARPSESGRGLPQSKTLARRADRISGFGSELFFVLYFAMTGLHGLHVLVGCGVLGVMFWLARKSRFSPRYHTPVEITGLYWHFVDVVWVFLYPMFYLVAGRPA